MSGSPGSSTQTVKQQIPNLLKPYVKDLLSRGQAASLKVTDQPYTGGFVAQPGQDAFTAAQQMGQVGQGLAGAGNAVFDLGQKTARGDFLTPEANPYLGSYVSGLQEAAGKTYAQNRQKIGTGAQAGGAYGGARHQLAESDYAAQSARDTNQMLSNLFYGNYLQERQLQQGAPGLIQAGAGLNLLSPEIGLQAAETTRGLNQLGLDQQIAQFNENAAAPFRPLQPYANLIYGSSPLFQNSTATVKGTPASPDASSQIIQALLGAGALAGSFA